MEKKKKLKFMGIFILLISALLVYSYALAEDDGKYEAIVITDRGTYSASVAVDDGQVVRIYRPNNEEIVLTGALLDGKEATGIDQDGDTVTIQLKNYQGEA